MTTLGTVDVRGRRLGSRGGTGLRDVRCECLHCGAHVQARTAGWALSGMCGVCGSYEISVLDPPATAGQG